MAYLTVGLSSGSYNPSTNSTTVSATVSITWNTSASYNQMNQFGTLTIGDSYTTTFSTNFNASRTENGTQVLGGGSTTIYHDSNGSPIQIVAWADGAGLSASNFITLTGGTPSGGNSGSGGGNTGGDTGGSTGGNTGGNTGGDTGGNTGGSTGGDTGGGSSSYDPWGKEHTWSLKIDQGAHTTITVIHTEGDHRVGEVLEDGAELSYVYGGSNYMIQVMVDVEEGFVLSECTISGENFKSGDSYYYGQDASGDGYTGGATIKTRAVPYIYVYINGENGPEKYIPYISNGEGWACYAPYIVRHDYLNGMFKATVNKNSGLNLMSSVTQGTSNTTICTIPYGTELVINGIEIPYSGCVVLKVTYMSDVGYVYPTNLSYELQFSVTNQEGAVFYKHDLSSGLVVDSVVPTIPYGTNIFTSTDYIGWSPIIAYQDECLIDVIANVTNGDITYQRLGYVKSKDVYMPKVRDVLEWVRYPYELEKNSGINVNLNEA